MFEKILYPTDFSDVAKKAMDYIAKLKEAGGKEVIVLHVIDERAVGDICQLYGSRGSEGMVMRITGEAYKEIGGMEAEFREKGFDVKVRIERGIPFRERLRVEEEEGVSAIVMGSHGKTNIEEMLLGSVSEKVIRKSKKPVLVIKR
jgi:nucleotide-binding universal stress UspA family protein